MLLKLSVLITFFILALKNSYALNAAEHEVFQKLALKGGLGLSYVDLSRKKTEEKFASPVINTQVSYYMGDFELTANANMSFGKINDLKYDLDGETLGGTGKVIDVSIGPILKYKTNMSMGLGNWSFYLGAGPAWSLYSISFYDTDQLKNSEYGITVDEYKLSYDTFGYNAILGFEEKTSYKSMHPVYIEMIYSYRRSRKLSLVDTEKFEEIDLAFEQEDNTFKYHAFIINMGITFF